MRPPVTEKINPADLQAYMEHRLTSHQLAAKIGCHPGSLRRAIQRPKKPPVKSSSGLIRARNAYRATVAHLPAQTLVKMLHVSISTAHRIKARHKEKLERQENLRKEQEAYFAAANSNPAPQEASQVTQVTSQEATK